MLNSSGEKGRENGNHKNLSRYRDIKEIGRYTPRLSSVVGAKKGEARLSPPTTLKTNPNFYKVLEFVRYRFYEKLLSTYGWLRLPKNYRRYLSKSLLKKSVIKGLAGVVRIDSIIADNSPKNEPREKTAGITEIEKATTSVEFIRTLLKYELRDGQIPFEVGEIVEILKKFEDGKRKLGKSEVRLKKLPYCSKHGHLRLEWRKEDLSLIKEELDINSGFVEKAKLKYHPHRCHSRICPICGYFDRREHYGELIDLLEKSVKGLNTKLAFATFTFKGFLTPLTAVEYSFRVRSKVYNLSLSKKLIKTLKPFVIKEAYEYGRQIRKKYPGVWRKIFKTHKKHIREFQAWFISALEEKLKEQKKVRIKDLFNLILKFEIHKTEKGLWHPHFHTIIDRFIPKLVLNAFWKYITEGRGEITDIRRLKGKKAIQEVNKYITKPVNSKITDLTKGVKEGITTANGSKLSYEEILLLEFSLYQRQTYAVWGNWENIRKELNKERNKRLKEKEELSFHLYKVSVLMEQSMFHIPKAIRYAERTKTYVEIGKGEIDFSYIFWDKAKETSYLKAKVKVFASPDGEIELRPLLKGEDLEAFYIVLVKAIKEHREFKKFFNLSENEKAVCQQKEIDISLYEGIEKIPKTLIEKMEINGLGFV